MTPPSSDPDPAAQAAWLLQRAVGEVEVPVVGLSMLPTIPERALVMARRARPEDLVPGHVVLLRGPQGLVVHRIVRRGRRAPGWLVTRGDNRRAPDAPVRAADVLGLVTRVADAGAWAAPAAAPRPTLFARALTGVLALLVELHPRLALSLAGLAHAVRHRRRPGPTG